MKLLITAALMLSLVGCAFEKDRSATTRKEVSDRTTTEKTFAPIIGTYQGTMTTPSRVHQVEITVFTLEVRTGTNPNGMPTYTKELRALYKKLDPVGPDVTFEARFYNELGNLILGAPSIAPKGADDVNTIDAKLIGQRLTGDVKSISGLIGRLDLSLVSKQQDVPDQGAESDYNERLRRQYEEVVGEYTGIVQPKASENAPFAITIRLSITVNANNVPVLTGELNYPFDRTMDQNLTVTYRADWKPARLAMIGKSRTNSSTNYTTTFDAAIEGNALVGSMSSSDRISEGTFRLIKK